MLLTFDIGNTSIKIGVYEGETLRGYWRIATQRTQLADEFAVLITNLLRLRGIELKQITGCGVSSVVPQVTNQIRQMVQSYLNVQPVIIGPGTENGLTFNIETPDMMGADRIANSLAALRKYGAPAIAIAFGTATAFDVLDSNGVYIGGAIAPGLSISADALFRSAARLYQIDLIAPPNVIGKNTVHYMQSGLIIGYAGLVEGLVKRMHNELGGACKVIATGGLADVVAQQTDAIDVVDRYLTLEGVRMIYELNRGNQ